MVHITEKTCKKCGVTKELSEFHRHIDSKDGVRWQCKQCINEARPKVYKKKEHRQTAFFLKYGVPKETIRNYFVRTYGMTIKGISEENLRESIEIFKEVRGRK